MAFDFPNTPSVGTRVTGVGGIVYVWDGAKWTNSVGGVTVQSMGDVGRNLLHNPLFNVAQRNAGPFTASGYTLDRWQLALSADTASVSQSAITDAVRTQIGDDAASYYLLNTFIGTVGTGAFTALLQPIEGVRRLGGKTVTISFWAWASAALKLGLSIDQFFGIGGSPSAGVSGTGSAVTLSTTATRYSVTLAVPSTIGKTLGTTAGTDSTSLLLWYSSGTTNNARAGGIGVQSGSIALWGVQLEIGNVATPLEKPDPRYDLANCQRFYSIMFITLVCPVATSLNGSAANITFPVSMRASPTLLAVHNAGTVTRGVSFAYQSAASTTAYMAGGAVAGDYEVSFLSASADF